VEIDYLEQNSNSNKPKEDNTKKAIKKASNIAQLYALVTQGFLMMLVIGAFGFLIGRYAIKDDKWAVILGVIGLLLGLAEFINLLFKFKTGGDSNGKSK
jgi:hypothetical protein